MTTYATGSRRETLRVVVTGIVRRRVGAAARRSTAPDSGLEVVAWAAEVRDAVPHFA